jgi:molybdopterin/thiamine biosynthesis adenylyltransferase
LALPIKAGAYPEPALTAGTIGFVVRAMKGRTRAKVLVVGAGGLGVPAALRLAQAGLTRITLIDPESIELSNLARQVIYRTSDIGLAKAVVAARRLADRFARVHVQAVVDALTAENAAGLVAEHDFIIDGTDDPATKFLINDTCVAAGRPFVYGGVLGFSGQAMTVIPGRTACLRCLFEEPPMEGEVASCRDAGILGPVAGFIGTVQAEEAIRLARGEQPSLAGRILTYDSSRGRSRITVVSPRRGCGCGAYENWSGAHPTAPPHYSGPTNEGNL